MALVYPDQKPISFSLRLSLRTRRAMSLAADEGIGGSAPVCCSEICIRSKILAIVLSQPTSHRRYHKTACHTATLCDLFTKHVSSPQEGLPNPLMGTASLQNISTFPADKGRSMPTRAEQFAGLSVAIVTPLRDGEVDVEKLHEQITFQVEAGTTAICPVGTTGESPTLSHKEHEQVISESIRAAQGKTLVMPGTGSNSTAESHSAHAICRESRCGCSTRGWAVL